MSNTRKRSPHATMDVLSRSSKGIKIEMLLKLSEIGGPLRVLDIGTGNGGIASYFGLHKQLACDVTSVDVVDQRQVVEGYKFKLLKEVSLPFDSGCFDVVISNHVIEHVGCLADQKKHLQEIFRVLASGGVGYLAVPNRWMLIEPHYKLPFLSWLPKKFRSIYLKMMGRGEFYDCEPLTVDELESVLIEAKFKYSHLHVESIRMLAAIEGGRIVSSLANLPIWILMLLRRATPTLVYKIQR